MCIHKEEGRARVGLIAREELGSMTQAGPSRVCDGVEAVFISRERKGTKERNDRWRTG